MLGSQFSNNHFGVGIIGAGTIFEQHALACEQLVDRARLLGVAEVDDAKLRMATAKHFIPFDCHDYRELLERKGIDIVTVCTPPVFHEKIVVEALEAGKYVLCEKPLAHTLGSADRIIEVARRFPGKLSIVYQFRYLPEVQRAIWLRDNGRLGPLLLGRFSRYACFQKPAKKSKPGKKPKPVKKRADWWGRWEVAGGGEVMTQLIHEIDLMYHIFGHPVSVMSVMDTLKEPIESEDTCAATLRFESGAIVCCYGTMNAHRSSNGFDVFGKLGTVHYPWSLECMDQKRQKDALRDVLAVYPPAVNLPPKLNLIKLAVRKITSRLQGEARAKPKPSEHTPYFAAVLDAIEAGRPLPIGPEEARASLEICTGIYASALTGAPISLPLDKTNEYYNGITTRDYDGRKRLQAGNSVLPAGKSVET